ncbi:H-NS family nucleoid-associated regulatory protein [Stenotrophomonas sp. Sm3119]|uniref:H-NS family nucleoid-associated regulatory protein n=1 Tax=Stenotrophomonas sp. Sm3119 TaxID=3002744 RepID=UPI0027E3EAE4|nr:H-NS family nucleoid-associated regulatory protein [Stenotrophomonas sp. Sm3119]MDQ7306482.1 H-NS family nucleoid-associated regulatory protein [Stenotrophomonas sp. Sm3119]
MALTTVQSIEAEIKQLVAQKRLVEARDGEVPKAIAILQKYAAVLTSAQRRKLASIAGEGVDGSAGKPPKAVSPTKGRKLGKVPPKYRLPTGETWPGRGLTPKIFAAWAKSAEGRSWVKANPGSKFPPATARAASGKKKTLKKVAGKKAGGKKPAKGPAKKTVSRGRKKAVVTPTE